jgi:hypothetical protein
MKIFFRGDNRHPNGIFTTGFKSKNEKCGISLTSGRNITTNFDVAVCFSARFDVALHDFPQGSGSAYGKEKFVYAIALDERLIYDVYREQIFSMLQMKNFNPQTDGRFIYAQEYCIKQISSESIIGALSSVVECPEEISRINDEETNLMAHRNTIDSEEFSKLIRDCASRRIAARRRAPSTLTMKNIFLNQNCTVDEKLKKYTVDFLYRELYRKHHVASHSPQSALHRSFPMAI